ncbi:MAG: DUF2846 domain-containing protein [SAR324 cluster bacterium]|nr:DUF2846 domain-containing protein [SAR324 cluster bacterium]
MQAGTGIRSDVWPPLAALLVASVLLLSGCGIFSKAPRASAEDNQRARLMAAPEGKALVYVYRNAIWAHSLDFDLTANGQTVGDSAALSYYVLVALPGKLTLTSQGSSNTLFNLVIGKRFGFERITLELAVEAGKKYFVFQDIRKWEPETGLRAVEESEGIAGMGRCRLIKVVNIKLAALPKSSAVIPAKPASEAPDKPASEMPVKPASEAPDKPASEMPDKPPTKPQSRIIRGANSVA